MVSFFFKSDPVKFIELVEEFGNDTKSEPALEKVYGHKLAELQAAWVKWAVRQR